MKLENFKMFCYQKILSAIVGALSIALSAGCSTSMMKATPFYSGKMIAGVTSSGKMVPWNDPTAVEIEKLDFNDKTKKLDANRVNVWPFFYDNFLVSSILWPIGEINDVGWEVRPFASVDNYNKRYRYLLHLGGYDGKDGSSYFFPIYKKDDDSFYSALFGWDKTSMYALPPAFIMNEGKYFNKYYIMWPIGEINESGWAVRPLVSVDNVNDHYKYLLPLGSYDGITGSSYFIPFYKKDDASFYSALFGWNEDFIYALPPVFIMNKGKDGNRYNIMWPLCSVSSVKKGIYSFPLFYYESNPEEKSWAFNCLMPLGWAWSNKHRWGNAFFPLFSCTGANLGVESFLTPLFGWLDSGDTYYILPPLFIRNKDCQYTNYKALWPFAELKVQNKNQESVAPFQGYLFPFFEFWREKDYSRVGAMWPLFLVEDDKRDKDRRELRRFLPFYYSYSDLKYSHQNYMLFFGNREWKCGRGYAASYCLPFYCKWLKLVYEMNVATKKRENYMEERSWFFPNIYLSENKEIDKHCFDFIPFYFYERAGSDISESSFLWLYTSSENTEEKHASTQALWYMYFHESQGKNETDEESSTTRILGELYHSENVGKEFNVNIFPFISYSKNKERKKFSFCWRLFSIERGKERSKAYFMFIPIWGW